MKTASLNLRPNVPIRVVLATAFLLAGIGGWLGLSRAADEQNRKKEAVKESDSKEEKKATSGSAKSTGPMTLKMTIASSGADVKEVSKLIDDKLGESWKANKITPSHFIDDHEFIRRASLDIIGRIAKPEEVARYMKDPPERRRSLLVDRLLESQDYANHWANLWTNWLLTRSGDFGRGKYHDQMSLWLAEQFALNKPISEIVTKLLTAKGKNDENGAGEFHPRSCR
jgi:hypothetical protein